MAGEVVVGYDGQDGSKLALSSAVAVAAAFGRPLVLVFGYEPNPQGGEVKDLRNAIRDVGERLLDDAEAAVKAQDATVVTVRELVADRPAEALLAAGEAYDALTIVVGASDRGPLRGALLGSVTYQVVHRSSCPVLVVPMPDE